LTHWFFLHLAQGWTSFSSPSRTIHPSAHQAISLNFPGEARHVTPPSLEGQALFPARPHEGPPPCQTKPISSSLFLGLISSFPPLPDIMSFFVLPYFWPCDAITLKSVRRLSPYSGLRFVDNRHLGAHQLGFVEAGHPFTTFCFFPFSSCACRFLVNLCFYHSFSLGIIRRCGVGVLLF